MELFKIDPGLGLWTWITFGITYFILNKYVFPQLMANIRNREEAIAQAVANASHVKQRLAEIETERAELIKESKIQASEILRQTRMQAEKLREELLKKAEQEGRAIVERAKEKIHEERRTAIETLKTDIADLVCDASEKVLGRSFTTEKDRMWVHDLMEKTL